MDLTSFDRRAIAVAMGRERVRASMTSMASSTRRTSGPRPSATVGRRRIFILRINFTGGTTVDDIIIYEPNYIGTIACGEWQTWDAADPNGT
jgi:hypothetical protein